MRTLTIALAGALLLAAAAVPQAAAPRETLDQLLRLLPESQPWADWLVESGELPPDFSEMPSCARLPDPLMTGIGPDARRIRTPEAWEAHRAELKALFEHWVVGSVPPPPDNLEAEVLLEAREAGATRREVQLRFGPDHKARLWLELLIPDGPGPFPIFMTQENHRSWSRIALQRGYIAVTYAGADSRDDTDTFGEAWPEYDWSRLMRRGWAAGRCLDYLETVPQADTARAALTGHSRNGKTSLMGAAFDERIAVVISSSSGAGGCNPTRLFTEHHYGEGVELITRSFPDWFHPRWRFFSGREDRLPVDLHQLVALCAPRPCLVATALHDGVENTRAIEAMYHGAGRVYDLLGAPDNLRIDYRYGGHGTWPTTIERYLDWCDLHFGRGGRPFPERLLHPHGWETWRARSGGKPYSRPRIHIIPALADSTFPPGQDDPEQIARVPELVRAMLGEEPPRAANPNHDYGLEKDHEEALLQRAGAGARLAKDDLVFGEYINADVYRPRGADESGEKLPCILWLPPACTSHGYVPAYLRAPRPHEEMARAGFAVFCYDPVGHGRRIDELEGFYDRYPKWSILGKMVRDAQSALDAIETLPYVDPERILVAGFGEGALVGMHLCALDARPAGQIAIGPPAPWRTAPDNGIGIRYWAQDTLLIPRLGYHARKPIEAPYDLDHLLMATHPRPVAVVSPALSWFGPREALESMAWRVQGTAAHGDHLKLLKPEDYNRLTEPMQKVVIDWLRSAAGLE